MKLAHKLADGRWTLTETTTGDVFWDTFVCATEGEATVEANRRNAAWAVKKAQLDAIQAERSAARKARHANNPTKFLQVRGDK